MPRATNAVASRKRHKKVLNAVEGYKATRGDLYRVANQAMMKSLSYAYRDRRNRKRTFRRLWITRINAAARAAGITYGHFVEGLRKAGIELDRKVLAEMAVSDSNAFAELVQTAKAQLA
ncbi:MAG: 50S ribosomal protein L20 [Chloroflexi bacterium]|nr:50S ribosomal protein L20 [Chloroflexota bacterium]